MRPLLVVLLCLIAGLARADSPHRGIEFEVCYLDIHQNPPVFRKHPKGDKFIIRADMIHAIADTGIKAEGIDCVKMGSTGGHSIFVVGTFESVKVKLGWE